MVTAVTFSSDFTTMTLTVDGATDVTVNIPEALRRGGYLARLNSDGSLPDASTSQGLYAPTPGGWVQSQSHVIAAATQRVVEWENYADHDSSFQGVITSTFFVPAHDATYYLVNNNGFYWVHTDDTGAFESGYSSGAVNPAGYSDGNHYQTEAVAEGHVGAIGDLFYIAALNTIRRVTNYVPPADEELDWHWTPTGVTLADVQEALAGKSLRLVTALPDTISADDYGTLFGVQTAADNAPTSWWAVRHGDGNTLELLSHELASYAFGYAVGSGNNPFVHEGPRGVIRPTSARDAITLLSTHDDDVWLRWAADQTGFDTISNATCTLRVQYANGVITDVPLSRQTDPRNYLGSNTGSLLPAYTLVDVQVLDATGAAVSFHEGDHFVEIVDHDLLDRLTGILSRSIRDGVFRIIRANDDGSLPAVLIEGDLFDSHENPVALISRKAGVYMPIDTSTPATEASITWVTDDGRQGHTSTNIANFAGIAHNISASSAAHYVENDIVFYTGDRHFYRAEITELDVIPISFLHFVRIAYPSAYIQGRFQTREQAEGSITATGQYAYIDDTSTIDYASAFNAGTGRVFSYREIYLGDNPAAIETRKVSALPEPYDVDASDYDKIWLTEDASRRVTDVSVIRPIEAARIILTVSGHGTGDTMRGYGDAAHGGYGHLTGIRSNIVQMFEQVSASQPTMSRIRLDVGGAADELPLTQTNIALYIREYGSAGDFFVVNMTRGGNMYASGLYLTADHQQFFVGKRVELWIVSQHAAADHVEVSEVPAANRIDFNPNGVEWNYVLSSNDIDAHNIILTETIVESVAGKANADLGNVPVLSDAQATAFRTKIGAAATGNGGGTADNETQASSAVAYEAGAQRLTVTVAKHPAEGDFLGITVPSGIDDSTSPLMLRTSDGTTFSAVSTVVDATGTAVQPGDLEDGQRVLLQLTAGNVYVGYTLGLAAEGTTSSGAASIGPAIGTFTLAASGPTSDGLVLYDTSVPTPTDGDLLIVEFVGDPTNDVSDQIAEVAQVPISALVAIPTAAANDTVVDVDDTDRNAVQIGWGQNDWLYMGVTVVAGGNLLINTNDNKYIGTFTFRVLTYAPDAAEQVAGAASALLRHNAIPSGDLALGLTPHSQQFTGQVIWTYVAVSPAIDKDKIHWIEVIFRVNTRFSVRFRLSKTDIELIGYAAAGTWTWTAGPTAIPAAYWAGTAMSDLDQEAPASLPSFFQANTRRQSNVQQLFMFLNEDTSGDNLDSLVFVASCSIGMVLQAAIISYEV